MADNTGKKCAVHYIGTFNDGTKFDSSRDRNEPLEFTCGAGQMIPGFDKAVAAMEVGEVIDIHLMPEEAYGMPDPANVIDFVIKDNPGSETLEVGQQIYLNSPMGPVPCVVAGKTEETVTVDANNEMAGKELNFNIELLSAE